MNELLKRLYAFLLDHYPHAEVMIHHRHLNLGDKLRETHFVSVWLNRSLYREMTQTQLVAFLDKEAPLPVTYSKYDLVVEAIRDYHLALDNREHGGVAQGKAFDKICATLGMYWTAGEEKARRESKVDDGFRTDDQICQDQGIDRGMNHG